MSRKLPLSRRDAVAALVGAGAGAAGGASFAAADMRVADARLAVADDWLARWSRGELAREPGRPGPVVTLGPHGDGSVRWRHTGLKPGDYLLSADRGRLDAVVSVPVEAGGRGEATLVRFLFEGADRPELTAVIVGDAGPRLIHRTLTTTDLRDPAAVQAAYDALVRSGGGTLAFPPGRHRINLRMTARSVGIVGAGMTATVLVAADPERPVLQALYNSGGWEPVEIASLGMVGNGGTGFMAGQRPRGVDDEFAGRTLFRSVRFEGFATAIDRPHGQIGLWLEHCVFEGGDVHLAAHDHAGPVGEPMHAGNCVARDCHFQGAQRAVIVLDSAVTGTGQISFDHCLFENNPGYVLFVARMNGTDGVPGLLLRSCWNENNATAATIELAGRRARPVFGDFTDCAIVRLEDTPPGPLRLRNSVVATRDCALDRLGSIDADARSTVRHSEARVLGSMVPQGEVLSVAGAFQFAANRAASFAMPARAAHPVPRGGRVVLSIAPDAEVRLAGSRPATTAFVGSERRLALAAGDRLHLTPLAALEPGWLAWLFDYRLVAGAAPAFQVGGGAGISTQVPLAATAPTCLAGMSAIDAPVNDIGLTLTADAAANIAISGATLVWFGTRQRALDFINDDRDAA